MLFVSGLMKEHQATSGTMQTYEVDRVGKASLMSRRRAVGVFSGATVKRTKGYPWKGVLCSADLEALRRN